MATSEPIFTEIAGAVDAQRLASPSLAAQQPAKWPQALADFVAIALGLSMPLLLGEFLGHAAVQTAPLSPVALAAMLVTICAFSGAYRRTESPLDIAATEGLLRGIGCIAILTLIAAIAMQKPPSMALLQSAAMSLFLVAAGRECLHLLVPRTTISNVYGRTSTSISRADPGAPSSAFFQVRCGGTRAYVVLKRAADFMGASVLLIAALPLAISVALMIKLDSRGPVLIRQRRIGMCGVPFYMWKFRSMHNDVPRYARSPVSDTDPRLTRFGRALRRFSIDELPQLLNVLHGEMSLVGPRPEMPFVVKRYDDRERLRLNCIPGITGLWQISPARAEPIHHNLDLDLFYIEHQNIFLDLAILLRTATAVFRGIGAR